MIKKYFSLSFPGSAWERAIEAPPLVANGARYEENQLLQRIAIEGVWSCQLVKKYHTHFWWAVPTLRMQLLQRIAIDPNICHGKPCIRGMRYPVECILELLSSGMSIDEILDDYDDLERDDILAVLMIES